MKHQESLRTDPDVMREPASTSAENALDAVDASQSVSDTKCEICGATAERKRRKNGGWYYYRKCRTCRWLPSEKFMPDETITDQRLRSLIFALYLHVISLRQGGWPNASKKQALKGVRILLGVLQQD